MMLVTAWSPPSARWTMCERRGFGEAEPWSGATLHGGHPVEVGAGPRAPRPAAAAVAVVNGAADRGGDVVGRVLELGKRVATVTDLQQEISVTGEQLGRPGGDDRCRRGPGSLPQQVPEAVVGRIGDVDMQHEQP